LKTCSGRRGNEFVNALFNISGEYLIEGCKRVGVGLEELRLYLICGDREKAVWSAVDRRLWGHAMIISSTSSSMLSSIFPANIS
jgi:hypothetical protein